MNEQKQHKWSKEEFAKMMNEKRQSLFNMANEQVEKAVESADNFLTYLNLKSQLDYTVTNTLLVMAGVRSRFCTFLTSWRWLFKW